jgi:hypothetical protein
MADREFASLVSKVQPSAPGCPYPMIVQYIRDSAIRVCERTLAWRYEQPKFQLSPGVYEYGFNKPANTDIHALFATIVNDRPLETLTLDDALRRYPMWADLYSGQDISIIWSQTPESTYNNSEYNEESFNAQPDYVLPQAIIEAATTPQVITQVSPDKYIVLPLPDDKPYTVRMFYALKPTRTATGMNSVALDELEDVIIHGALQHLLVLPQVHWTDRELASYHAKQYVFHISERRARANLGNARSSVSVRMHPFA